MKKTHSKSISSNNFPKLSQTHETEHSHNSRNLRNILIPSIPSYNDRFSKTISFNNEAFSRAKTKNLIDNGDLINNNRIDSHRNKYDNNNLNSSNNINNTLNNTNNLSINKNSTVFGLNHNPNTTFNNTTASFFQSLDPEAFNLSQSKTDLHSKIDYLKALVKRKLSSIDEISKNHLDLKISFLNGLFLAMQKKMRDLLNFSDETENILIIKLLELELGCLNIIKKLCSQFIQTTLALTELNFNLNKASETQLKDEEINNNKVSLHSQKSKAEAQSKTELSLQLENVKLAAEVKFLNKKLINYESQSNFSSLLKEFDSLKLLNKTENDHLRENLSTSEKQLRANSLLIGNYKMTVSKFEAENVFLRETKNSLELENVELSENFKNSKVMQRYAEERLSMVLEDYELLFTKREHLKQICSKLKYKVEELQEKVGKLTGNKIDNPQNPEEKNFTTDREFFVSMKMSFVTEAIFFKTIKNDYKGFNSSEMARNKIKLFRINEYDSDVLEQNFNSNKKITPEQLADLELNKILLAKPKFFDFIEHKYDSYISEIEGERENRINANFIGMLRGILDSKYNEYMIENDWRKYSHFPEFVYSWLGKFVMCEKTRKIKAIESNSGDIGDDNRMLFLLDLTNPKLSKLWEVVTFRDLLQEKNVSDELYFYLHCRNLLFKGPQLNLFESTFDIIHYVSLDWVYTIIDLIFYKYERQHLRFLKGKIKEKGGKMTMNGSLVDSAFCLRLFLEYFRAEKVLRLKLMKDLFYSHNNFEVSNAKTFSISFESFKKILNQNFPNMSDLEKAELYRQTWNMGRGAVTPEAFFAVGVESNFFIKALKLKTLFDIPIKLEFNKKLSQESSLFSECDYILREFENLAETFRFIDEDLPGLGNEKLLLEINNIKQIIKGKLQTNNDELKETYIIQIIHNLIAKTLNATNIFIINNVLEENVREKEVKADNNSLSMMLLHDQIKILKQIQKISLKYTEHKKQQNNDVFKKVKKLQGFFKNKLSKWYTLLTYLLGHKLKKAKIKV